MATMSKPRTRSDSSPVRAKVEQPAKTFADPMDVITDRSLSTDEKFKALSSLEQDARQLAAASAEGMDGGEDSQLRRVLQAKRSLRSPSAEMAFEAVLHTFEQQLPRAMGTETYDLLVRTIDDIRKARTAIADLPEAPPIPPGATAPGSKEELQEELAKEKLDPGT